MKFDEDQMAESSIAVATKKVEAAVVDIKYNTSKAVLTKHELDNYKQLYQQRAIVYLKTFNIEIVPDLKTALINRANGSYCCTIREADIFTRCAADVRHIMELSLLSKFSAFVTEDDVCEEDIFALRLRFNRGVHWRKHFKDLSTTTENARQAGLKLLSELEEKFKARKLAAYPEEIEHGFSEELLTPEWVTPAQLAQLRHLKL